MVQTPGRRVLSVAGVDLKRGFRPSAEPPVCGPSASSGQAEFAHGFARAGCDDCGDDYLVAFSCKGRGICPVCNTRRMAEAAAHLCDHVFPRLPVRQWVLSVPKRLRYYLQRDRGALNASLRIFLRVVRQSLQTHCPAAANADPASPHLGAVAFIHRFGSSLNTHVHSPVCVVDRVFEALPEGLALPDWEMTSQSAPDYPDDQRTPW